MIFPIFLTVFRVEKSRSEKTGGSGLGLAIAKNIVDLHGGQISAYAYTDKTVFEVSAGRGKTIDADGADFL
jgi:signal transduction histidine kinase